jgi:hypothetical protein
MRASSSLELSETSMVKKPRKISLQILVKIVPIDSERPKTPT